MASPGPRFRISPINISASGDNVVLAGTGTLPINIHGLFLVAGGIVSLTYKNGASQALSGPINLLAGGSQTLDKTQGPWYVCGAAAYPTGGFVINLSAAVQVSGTVYYTYGGI